MTEPVAVDIVIVGAGVAGLAAARRCLAAGLSVTVLEASGSIGGRVRSVPGFVRGFSVEAGATYIHGTSHAVYEHAVANSWRLHHADFPSYLYLPAHDAPGLTPSGVYDFRQEDDPNVAQLQSFIHHVVDEEIMAEDEAYKSLPPEEDLSLQQYMERLGYAPIVQRLVDAVVCNDWCNHISRIGLRELLSCEASWPHGTSEILPQEGMSTYVQHLAEGVSVLLSMATMDHIVRRIQLVDNAVRITADTPSGTRVFSSRHAIVAVPLPVLKDGDIAFEPPLPAPKLRAIQQLEAGPAAKVFLKFNSRFWPEDLTSLVMVDGLLPEVFASPYTGDNAEDGRTLFLLTGFVCGESSLRRLLRTAEGEEGARPPELPAVRWDKMSRQERAMVNAVLSSLDDMAPKLMQQSEMRPAWSSLTDWLFFNWAEQPFVRCGYSSPGVHSKRERLREKLAASVGGVLHFAGEATSELVDVTVVGAMNTGERAAEKVISVLAAGRRD